jgi:hypothetical protein
MVFNNVLYIISTGAGGHLHLWYATPGATTWNIATFTDATVTGSPTTMVFNNMCYVIAAGTDGYLRLWYATPGATTWNFATFTDATVNGYLQ